MLARMPILRASLLAIVALLATAATATAAAPTAPPTILAGPAGTVTDKTPITFRIQAAAADAQAGHWAVLISGGNDAVLELEPTASDPSVYERTIKLHNDAVYAGQRKDDTIDFSLPRVPNRIFPGTIEWSAVFFPDSKRSTTGDARTRTDTQSFEFQANTDRQTRVYKPRLPSAKSHLIVPGKSIGGIRIGFTRRQVLRRWGQPFLSEDQFYDRTDDWARGTVSGGDARLRGDYGEIYFDQDIARTVEIGRPGSRPHTFSAWRTTKGIRLGAKVRAVEKAYPNAEPLEDEDGNFDGYSLAGKANETVFDFDRHGRLDLILLRDNDL
jgi:hypothetical protein